MLCWKWTTSQVSGSGRSPNTLLTEITDRDLIVTQPQSHLQTTIGVCLAQARQSANTSMGFPRGALERLSRIWQELLLASSFSYCPTLSL